MKYEWRENMSRFGITKLEDSDGEWEDDLCYYYEDFDNAGFISVGVKKTFDRWASSRDFCFRPPKTFKSHEKIINRIRYLVENGYYDKKCGRKVIVRPKNTSISPNNDKDPKRFRQRPKKGKI